MSTTTESMTNGLMMADETPLNGLLAEEMILLGDDMTEGEGGDGEAFWPDTRKKVDWVLKQIMLHRMEADKHRAMIAQLTANVESMARDEEREIEHLLLKFGPALREFAQKDLEARKGRPGRSVKFYHGVIGFETEPQRFAVLPGQERLAVAWAKQHRPEVVIEGVDKKALAKMVGVGEDGLAVDRQTGEQLAWAAVTPASDPFAPHTFFVKQPSPKKKAGSQETGGGGDAAD